MKGTRFKTEDGLDRTFYTITELTERLSEAIKSARTIQTIRKWENFGRIPPALFRYGNKRYYSLEQVELICKIAKEENIASKSPLAMSKFSKRVFAEMEELNKTMR